MDAIKIGNLPLREFIEVAPENRYLLIVPRVWGDDHDAAVGPHAQKVYNDIIKFKLA